MFELRSIEVEGLSTKTNQRAKWTLDNRIAFALSSSIDGTTCKFAMAGYGDTLLIAEPYETVHARLFNTGGTDGRV